jgi:alpha-tubulin suppressor-like RCC1 family protein
VAEDQTQRYNAGVYNADGELGNNSLTDQSTPALVGSLSGVAEVSGGVYHTCARTTDNKLWCWGYNGNGELGDGTTTDRSVPAQVTGLGTTVAGVSAGDGYTCATTTNGQLYCWGWNGEGELGNGSLVNSSVPVQVTDLANSVASVTTGLYHTCARKSDNTLWCWGVNEDGELGNGNTTDNSRPVQVSGLSNVAAVAVGDYHTCARTTDNKLWCWGFNGSGQLGDGTTVTRITSTQVTSLGATATEVVAGASHTCARKTDNSLWCWGYNASGQIGDGSTTSRINPTQVVGPNAQPVPALNHWMLAALAALLGAIGLRQSFISKRLASN